MKKARFILFAFWVACEVQALINVRFTPVDLVRQSRTIAVGRLEATKDPGVWHFRLLESIKGEPPESITLDLSACKHGQKEQVCNVFRNTGADPVIIFEAADTSSRRGFLHAGGNWFALAGKGGRDWAVWEFDLKMAGTFAGGTDMLVRMCRYIQHDPQAEVPVSVGVGWLRTELIARLAAEVRGLAVVGVGTNEVPALFVASETGDKLFRKEAGEWHEITAQCRLVSESRCFTWCDVNGDGMADLLSCKGTRLAVFMQGPDGKFLAVPNAAFDIGGASLGLHWLGRATSGSPRFVVNTASLPYILEWRSTTAGGTWRRTELPVPGTPYLQMGTVTACVVADLDNDGFADVMQLRAGGALLWYGRKNGFLEGRERPVATGDGPACVALGDFDGDGSLDIFVSSSVRNTLWENNGTGGFRDVLNFSGSLSYKTPPAVSDCVAADLNQDGRQDLALCYRDAGLIYHFNRGFRCFGEEGELRLAEAGEGAPEEGLGVLRCSVADFNSDGADDFVAVLTDGTVRCFLGDCGDAPGIRVQVDGSVDAPVTASLWQDCGHPVCMGTWILPGFGPAQRMTAWHAGPCTLRWSAPGLLRQAVQVEADTTLPLVTLKRK